MENDISLCDAGSWCKRTGLTMLHSQVSRASSYIFLLLLLPPSSLGNIAEANSDESWLRVEKKIFLLLYWWSSSSNLNQQMQNSGNIFINTAYYFDSNSRGFFSFRIHSHFFKYSQVGDRNVVWIWQACRIRLRAVIWHGLFILSHLKRVFSKK